MIRLTRAVSQGGSSPRGPPVRRWASRTRPTLRTNGSALRLSSAMTEREIFTAALHKPPEERAAFLDEACDGNTSLRLRVEALLHEQAQLGSYLEAPAVAIAATVDPSPS